MQKCLLETSSERGEQVHVSERIVEQFRKPSGMLGTLAGWTMAARASNRRRNEWTVAQLGLRPSSSVLEIGFGPGCGLSSLFETVPDACVVAIDHSQVMLRQAAMRNRQMILAKKLELLLGSVEVLEDVGIAFDAAFSCNVMQFVPERPVVLSGLRDALKPGGVLASTFQPRSGDVSRDAGISFAANLAEECCQAGYVDVDIRELALHPTPAFCVTAISPG